LKKFGNGLNSTNLSGHGFTECNTCSICKFFLILGFVTFSIDAL
jgi:hypothetical protein